MKNSLLTTSIIIISFLIFLFSIITTHIYFIFYPFPKQIYNFLETEIIGSLSSIFLAHLVISLIIGRFVLVFYTFVHAIALFTSALSHVSKKTNSSDGIYTKASKLYKRVASKRYIPWLRFENRNFVGFSLLIFYVIYIDNDYFLALSIPIGIVYAVFFHYTNNGRARMSGNELAVSLKFYSIISLPLIGYISASTGYFRGLHLMNNEVIVIEQNGQEFSGSLIATSAKHTIYYDKENRIVKIVPWNEHKSVIFEELSSN